MIDILEKAAEKAGGLTKLAAHLKVRHQSLYSWTRVPAERALEIEKLTGIPRHEMRPDLWPAPERAA